MSQSMTFTCSVGILQQRTRPRKQISYPLATGDAPTGIRSSPVTGHSGSTRRWSRMPSRGTALRRCSRAYHTKDPSRDGLPLAMASTPAKLLNVHSRVIATYPTDTSGERSVRDRKRPTGTDR